LILLQSQALDFPRFFRIESPRISIRCVVHEVVEDAISQGWITDLLMPAGDWQL